MDSWLGNALILVGGFVLLIWDRNAAQPETGSSPRNDAALDAAASKEIERLNKEIERRDRKIRNIAQEYDELRAKLSDPTTKRQRDERMARERCAEVAYQYFTFMQNRPYPDHAETVAAFKQRQQWKVDEARSRMEEQGLLTPLERQILTFREGDQLDKIEMMVELLRKLAAEK